MRIVGIEAVLGILSIFCILVVNADVFAETGQEIEVGVDEKLGAYVPLNLIFTDEKGSPVKLGDLVNKPAILTLVYFRCPAICSPLLAGVADVLSKLQMDPGSDYIAITISIDDTENYQLAADKKSNYLKSMESDFPPDAWRYLTGSRENIDKVADAVGYRFKKQGKDFAHPAVMMILSPEGKLVRYFNGITYLPFDLKLSLIEAAEGKVGPTINRVLLFCFSYNPDSSNYSFNVIKVSGTLTIMFAGVFLAVLIVKGKTGKPKSS